MKGPSAYDMLGNIAIVNFQSMGKKVLTLKEKKKYAESLLKRNGSLKTVFEKTGKVKGRLRKPELRYLAGEKNKEVLYRENGCVFRFNVETTYFSPRLSNERKELTSKIKKDDKVLVMFAGVAPFSIEIAKNSKASFVVSNEINREANKYGKLNVGLNKIKDKVEIVGGDARKLVEKLKGKNFDVIVMPRPQLKDSFLDVAFKFSKKGTRIYYYDFCGMDEVEKIVEKIKFEAKKTKKKIRILKKKKAGEIAPYKIRLRIDFVVV